MNKDEKDLTESEDTEVAETPTPEKEEDQCEASEPEAKCIETNPSVFYAEIDLHSELIASKPLQEIIGVLDTKLKAIRDAAIIKVTELKN